MNAQCAKCGMPLEAGWGFCPHCGSVVAHEGERTAAPQKHEAVPVKGAFSGLLFGVILTPVLLISGGMLCCTGLGAFLGVPLIILGILAPLIGPTLGMNAVRGTCPWCGAKVSSISPIDTFVCWSCQKKIQVKHRELLRA